MAAFPLRAAARRRVLAITCEDLCGGYNLLWALWASLGGAFAVNPLWTTLLKLTAGSPMQGEAPYVVTLLLAALLVFWGRARGGARGGDRLVIAGLNLSGLIWLFFALVLGLQQPRSTAVCAYLATAFFYFFHALQRALAPARP